MIELEDECDNTAINDLNDILNILKDISSNPQNYAKKTEQSNNLVKTQINNIRNVIRKGNLDNYFDVGIIVSLKVDNYTFEYNYTLVGEEIFDNNNRSLFTNKNLEETILKTDGWDGKTYFWFLPEILFISKLIKYIEGEY